MAKVLPGFSQEKRLQTYKGVLKEAIQDGYVEPATSLDSFQQMRRELGISDGEHDTILTALGQEYPDLFAPNRGQSRENMLRLESYRESLLETILGAWKDRPGQVSVAELMKAFSEDASPDALEAILKDLSQSDRKLVQTIRQEYGITDDDETAALRQTESDDLWHAIAERIGLLDYLKTGGEDQLRDIFQQIDADGSGYISAMELRKYIQAVDPNFTAEQIEAMLSRADTSGDDQVSFAEFQSVFQSIN